jgi:hypothetical protein
MCLIYFAVPPSVSGQTYRSFSWEVNNIQEVTKWHVGPFRISPRIYFRNIGYDQNVYRQSEEHDLVSDFTATISPVIDTYVILKNWVILDFSVNPEYVYYAKTEGERSFNLNYSTGAKLNLFHRFVLTGEYVYDKSRRRASSEFDVRANQLSKTVTGGLFYETNRGTSFGITTSIREIKFEDEDDPRDIYLSRQLNRTEIRVNGEIYYNLREETDLFLIGGYADYAYEYEESLWRDSYSYQGSVGIRFPILGNVTGTISFGYKNLSPRAGYLKKFSGPIWRIDLQARLKRFLLRGRLSEDVHVSYWTNNAFFVEYLVGAGLSYYLTQFLRLDYDFSYGENQYPEKTIIRLPDESYEEILRRDKILTHRLGTVFRIFQNTGLGIMLDYWERNSNDYRWGRRRSLFFGGYITYDF